MLDRECGSCGLKVVAVAFITAVAIAVAIAFNGSMSGLGVEEREKMPGSYGLSLINEIDLK